MAIEAGPLAYSIVLVTLRHVSIGPDDYNTWSFSVQQASNGPLRSVGVF